MMFRGRNRVAMYAAAVPGFLFYVVFAVVPSIATIIISLTNYTSIPGVPAQFVGLQNYVQIFVDEAPGLWNSILDTLIFAAAVVIFQNAAALAVATFLRHKTPLVQFFRSLIFLPVVLGVTVIGLLWALIFNPSGGPAENFLGLFHKSSGFFGSSHIALPLVIFVQIWAMLGFTTLVYLAGMNAIPGELFEAAALDGADRWTVFRQVTFPLIAQSMTVNVLLAAVGALNTYDLIYVLTDGQNNTNTLGMFMFNTAFQGSGDLGLGATLSVVMFIVTLIVAIPLQRYLRRREEDVS
ncbi:carbohydrate ABC transporter permease [Sulfobacillus harzensis]|uniref:Sugar ABC transporter permease n=1 Tax=Sulfobacillus harzensis TaxID=2729629 RepID=A0A7Y0L6G4_9FIRM|nr:sugar ABC transporter permease [Sulfobacillus harzensis]NMP23908.1 sugar ABC transporter permease [Sulfobacillus harzensis]